MPTFEVKYHFVSHQCCNRKPPVTKTLRVEAENEDQVRTRLRELFPAARFESIKLLSNPGEEKLP